ncbi:MAG: hypothetical protein AB8G11_20850 [Saprospiraceae bacterium]
MLQLFRTNSPIAAILLLVYISILRLHEFIIPNPNIWEPTNPNFFSEIVYDWVGTDGLTASLIALFLVFIQAFILNQIVLNNKMRRTATYYPAVAYVLVASAIPEFLELHPLHFANTFFIIAISQLFKSYRKYEAASELFNIGFCIAVGSLFYFSMNIFIIFAVLGLTIIRSFNLRELFIIFIGFIVPFFLAGTYLLWIDSFDTFRNIWANFYFFDFNFTWNAATYMELGLLLFIASLSLINFQAFFYKTNIQVQKYINMIYWALFIGLFSFIYQGNVTTGHLLILAPSLAIFLAFSLLKIKNAAVAEFLHFTLLLIVLILQYRTILKEWLVAN